MSKPKTWIIDPNRRVTYTSMVERGSAISRDTRRRRAMVWMLHQTGLSYGAIGKAFEMSRARAGELGATYDRMIERRRLAAQDWPEAFARRLRAAGAIP